MKKQGILFIMSGPSGVGKGTIREMLMKDKSINLFYSISMTTRKIRPGEVNGREYYFVSKDEFMENVKKGNLLEWAEYVGNCYGTPKDKVQEMLDEGKNVLLEIEVNGASSVINKMPNVVSIFIAPPSFVELANRLRGRGTESEKIIEERVERARKELKFEKQYKYIVINDDLNNAVNKVKEIIESQN